MVDDILVPLDGSEEAAGALDHAADLAARVGATVHLLSVVDVRALETAPDVAPNEAHAQAILDEAAADHDDSSSWERAVRTGVPHETILEYVADGSVDLVAMGTHGRTGLDRVLLGSVTEKVIRLSDVPVLTVRTGEDTGRFPYQSVLIPTDGSDGARAAVGPTATIAAAYGATVHVVSVVDTRSLGLEGAGDLVVDNLDDMAERAVSDLRNALASHGIEEIETAIGHGTPYRTLLEYVEREDIDLVGMGTHGRSGVERYLLGSVTEKLVRTAPANVLTVRGE